MTTHDIDITGPWDLVVVGHGFAGLSAAVSFLETYRGDAPRVAVLDRAKFEDRGGSTAWTTANFRLDDTGRLPADFGEIVRKTAGDSANDGYIDNFYANVSDTLDWVQERGVAIRTTPDAAIPGMFATTHNCFAGGGKDFLQKFESLAERLGATFFYEVDLVGLERDGAGPVTGVRVRTTEGEHVLPASAVVLASGGFEGDRAELGRRIPGGETLDTVSAGTRVNTGAGIHAAVAVGAAKAGQYDGTHLEPVDARSDATEPLVSSWLWGILVDHNGKRFIDEAEHPFDMQFDFVAKAVLASGGIAYSIHDASVAAGAPMLRFVNQTELEPIVADSIRELAQKLNLSPDSLEHTVEEYNAAASDAPYDGTKLDGKHTQGITPPKSHWAQPLTQGPFEAWPVKAQICFTFEGLKVDDTTHVLDEQGERIPGLYAAGEIVGLFYGDTYPAGTSGLRSMTFGRIAGRELASEIKATPAMS